MYFVEEWVLLSLQYSHFKKEGLIQIFSFLCVSLFEAMK